MFDQGSRARLRAAVRTNPELDAEIASLDLLDDAALWDAAQVRMPRADSERMEAFHRKQRLTGLLDAETQELARLEQQYDRVILVRTYSASLLEQRGYDIRRLISSNASRKYQEKMAKKLPNIHPGEVLLEEFLKPMEISQSHLAREISVPPRRINEIVLGKRSISSDTALRLARYFDTSERFWLGLQVDFDLEEARNALADRLEREVKPRAEGAQA